MALQTADLNRVMNNLRIRVPGALDVTLQLELYNVLNDFFQRTNIWTEDLTFPVQGTESAGDTIDIDPDEGVINQLMYVLDSGGKERQMSMGEPGVLDVIEIPGAPDTWTARVAITVNDPVNSKGFPVAPAWVLNKYNSGIVDGVLGRMFAHVAKPYSSEKFALFHTRSYNSTVAQAKVAANHRNTYRAQNWRFPQAFATTRRQ